MKKCLFVGFWLLLAASGEAFPTWMGVYGTIPRHNGVNPGQFTILMNEDYFGLQANVGIRVNGGDWQESAMSYQTNVNGNSVWAYVPPEPFPFGAEVDYYFHGFEGTNHVYDSANSANYFSGPLFWTAPEDTGLISSYPGNNYGKVRMCTLGGDLMGAHSIGVLGMARRSPGTEWEALAYPLEDTGIADFAIAGDEATLVVARLAGTNVAVRMSSDRGETFSASVPVAVQPENATFSGLSVASGRPGEFGLVYGVSTNCCGAQQLFFLHSTNSAATWSAPVVAMDSGDAYAYYSWQELGHNDEGWFLAARSIWPGSSTLIMNCARSTNGAAWTNTVLGGNRAWSEPDMSLSSNTVGIAADPYFDSFIRVWSCQGGIWSTQSVARALESGRTVRLSNDGHGRWFVFRQVDNNAGSLWGTFLSRDNGQTWTTNRALPNPAVMSVNDNFTLEQVLNVGPKQYVLWHADYYIGTFQRMHEAQLQSSDGYEERMDAFSVEGSSFTVSVANVAPGATNHLEISASLSPPAWKNVATWRGNGTTTNWTGTTVAQGYYRVRIER